MKTEVLVDGSTGEYPFLKKAIVSFEYIGASG
jgi:hypothetical protein